MHELAVTQMWMGGVMLVMLGFGLIAFVGYVRRK